MAESKSTEQLEQELEAAKGSLRSLEGLELPHPDSKRELDWLDENFANLSHEDQARLLDLITSFRVKHENTTTWRTL